MIDATAPVAENMSSQQQQQLLRLSEDAFIEEWKSASNLEVHQTACSSTVVKLDVNLISKGGDAHYSDNVRTLIMGVVCPCTHLRHYRFQSSKTHRIVELVQRPSDGAAPFLRPPQFPFKPKLIHHFSTTLRDEWVHKLVVDVDCVGCKTNTPHIFVSIMASKFITSLVNQLKRTFFRNFEFALTKIEITKKKETKETKAHGFHIIFNDIAVDYALYSAIIIELARLKHDDTNFVVDKPSCFSLSWGGNHTRTMNSQTTFDAISPLYDAPSTKAVAFFSLSVAYEKLSIAVDDKPVCHDSGDDDDDDDDEKANYNYRDILDIVKQTQMKSGAARHRAAAFGSRLPTCYSTKTVFRVDASNAERYMENFFVPVGLGLGLCSHKQDEKIFHVRFLPQLRAMLMAGANEDNVEDVVACPSISSTSSLSASRLSSLSSLNGVRTPAPSKSKYRHKKLSKMIPLRRAPTVSFSSARNAKDDDDESNNNDDDITDEYDDDDDERADYNLHLKNDFKIWQGHVLNDDEWRQFLTFYHEKFMKNSLVDRLLEYYYGKSFVETEPSAVVQTLITTAIRQTFFTGLIAELSFALCDYVGKNENRLHVKSLRLAGDRSIIVDGDDNNDAEDEKQLELSIIHSNRRAFDVSDETTSVIHITQQFNDNATGGARGKIIQKAAYKYICATLLSGRVNLSENAINVIGDYYCHVPPVYARTLFNCFKETRGSLRAMLTCLCVGKFVRGNSNGLGMGANYMNVINMFESKHFADLTMSGDKSDVDDLDATPSGRKNKCGAGDTMLVADNSLTLPAKRKMSLVADDNDAPFPPTKSRKKKQSQTAVASTPLSSQDAPTPKKRAAPSRAQIKLKTETLLFCIDNFWRPIKILGQVYLYDGDKYVLNADFKGFSDVGARMATLLSQYPGIVEPIKLQFIYQTNLGYLFNAVQHRFEQGFGCIKSILIRNYHAGVGRDLIALNKEEVVFKALSELVEALTDFRVETEASFLYLMLALPVFPPLLERENRVYEHFTANKIDRCVNVADYERFVSTSVQPDLDSNFDSIAFHDRVANFLKDFVAFYGRAAAAAADRIVFRLLVWFFNFLCECVRNEIVEPNNVDVSFLIDSVFGECKFTQIGIKLVESSTSSYERAAAGRHSKNTLPLYDGKTPLNVDKTDVGAAAVTRRLPINFAVLEASVTPQLFELVYRRPAPKSHRIAAEWETILTKMFELDGGDDEFDATKNDDVAATKKRSFCHLSPKCFKTSLENEEASADSYPQRRSIRVARRLLKKLLADADTKIYFDMTADNTELVDPCRVLEAMKRCATDSHCRPMLVASLLLTQFAVKRYDIDGGRNTFIGVPEQLRIYARSQRFACVHSLFDFATRQFPVPMYTGLDNSRKKSLLTNFMKHRNQLTGEYKVFCAAYEDSVPYTTVDGRHKVKKVDTKLTESLSKCANALTYLLCQINNSPSEVKEYLKMVLSAEFPGQWLRMCYVVKGESAGGKSRLLDITSQACQPSGDYRSIQSTEAKDNMPENVKFFTMFLLIIDDPQLIPQAKIKQMISEQKNTFRMNSGNVYTDTFINPKVIVGCNEVPTTKNLEHAFLKRLFLWEINGSYESVTHPLVVQFKWLDQLQRKQVTRLAMSSFHSVERATHEADDGDTTRAMFTRLLVRQYKKLCAASLNGGSYADGKYMDDDDDDDDRIDDPEWLLNVLSRDGTYEFSDNVLSYGINAEPWLFFNIKGARSIQSSVNDEMIVAGITLLVHQYAYYVYFRNLSNPAQIRFEQTPKRMQERMRDWRMKNVPLYNWTQAVRYLQSKTSTKPSYKLKRSEILKSIKGYCSTKKYDDNALRTMTDLFSAEFKDQLSDNSNDTYCLVLDREKFDYYANQCEEDADG